MAITPRDALTTVRARTVHADWDDTGSATATLQARHGQYLMVILGTVGKGDTVTMLDVREAMAQLVKDWGG